MSEVMTAREIAIRELNGLRGRLCSVIESADLPKRQERAMITLVKTTSYQSQAVIAELLNKLDAGEVMFTYGEKLDGPIDEINSIQEEANAH